MKQIALILALTLLGTSIKGAPVVQMVKTTIGLGDCSHSSDTTNSCHSDSDESDNCCGDMDCECTCCVHILILTSMTQFKFVNDPFADTKHTYAWDYHRDYLASIFHPPALV